MSEDQLPYRQRLLMQKNGLLPKTGPKPKKPIAKVSKKRAKENAEAKGGGETELQKWYAKIMDSETAKCWETGEKLNKADKLGWHGSVAHCLPKSLFPSVATHPQNYMILSMWNGIHAQYDSSWERAAKMKIWPYALKIITTVLYPLLTSEERRKLPDIIIQEIPPNIYNEKTI